MSVKYSDARVFRLTFDDCIAVLVDTVFNEAMNFSCISSGFTPAGDGCFYKYLHKDTPASAGEEVTIGVTPAPDGNTCIEIMSETQLLEQDFGKNKEIVEAVFGVFACLDPIDFPTQKQPQPQAEVYAEPAQPYVEQHARSFADPAEPYADPAESFAEHARPAEAAFSYEGLMSETTLSDYDEQYEEQAAQPAEIPEPAEEDQVFGSTCICHMCGEVLPEGSSFCTACGTKLVVFEDIVCPSCGNSCTAGSHFCTMCGTKLK